MDEFTTTIKDSVGQTNSVEISLKVGGKIKGLVEVTVAATYGHEWTTEHTFIQELNMPCPPHSRCWFTGTAPLLRDTGDFRLTMGNTTWNLYGVYFDSPNPNGNPGYQTNVRPLTAGQLNSLPRDVMIQTGTAGDDHLVGTKGKDLIFAKAGNDTVRSLGGADRVYTGPGQDLVSGGAGHDRLHGGGGHDGVDGGRGHDRIFGGGGNDRLHGGRNDVLGRPGHDRLRGGLGHDRLWGGDGNDILLGGPGNDRPIGGPGGDDVRP